MASFRVLELDGVVLIPFGAGMFFYYFAFCKSLHENSLNPFWCRDVFLLKRKIIIKSVCCLNPFWCRDVFL